MFKNFFIGIKAYGGAFSLIGKLGLWRYFFVPILISIVTAFSIGFLAWGLSDNIGQWIAKIWVWEWGTETFKTISDIIAGIAIIAVGLILYKHIIMALSAPFMGAVSEKIEEHLIGKEVKQERSQFLPLLWRGIRVNLRNLLMELLFTIPILLLGFIPIIGFISTPLLFLVQAYYAGYGNMDYTLERHFSYSKSNAFVRAHSGIATGIGSVFMLLLLIPILGIILVLPLSVTAASTTTLEIIIPSENKKQ
ncbi:EI24 domain-containing protein [Aureisphaera sp. CAU 1614]|uniref:EI24 domain-containing protein n=1 Tax=Halomarinibacterium sedimenti TaxID=2857106 RepID=A0A9X1FMJ4_9FLAO|nr:EI24 domain-containing protein [Halomarinibacterium sedimenti]MBW2937177.1 EI24 domain-containing protein [Halomarinibacterium sedimenti]